MNTNFLIKNLFFLKQLLNLLQIAKINMNCFFFLLGSGPPGSGQGLQQLGALFQQFGRVQEIPRVSRASVGDLQKSLPVRSPGHSHVFEQHRPLHEETQRVSKRTEFLPQVTRDAQTYLQERGSCLCGQHSE